jgi:hypothetical protein
MSTIQQPPAQPVEQPTEPKARNRPPTWVIVAGVVLVIWAVVAMWPNSSSDPAGYSGTDTGGYTAPVISQNSDRQLYLATVNATVHSQYPNRVLLTVGHTICRAFDRGVSWRTITVIGTENGVDPYDIGVVMGGAVGAFCPEHQSMLP